MSDGIVAGLIQPMRLSSRPGPFLDVNGSAEVKQRDAVRQIPPNETGARRNQRATGRIIATTRLSNKRRGRESNPRIEVLQTPTLPLGYPAFRERETRSSAWSCQRGGGLL